MDGLSTNAKNVQVIPRSGQVTLKGPVDSRREKGLVADLARGIPGVRGVDDEMRVEAH